ncbi:MAG: hypothetical protein GEU79_11475 [Acidimicrobiia bacterium]|nr:hypothetical protein [Acidimicrobiia bacterium]
MVGVGVAVAATVVVMALIVVEDSTTMVVSLAIDIVVVDTVAGNVVEATVVSTREVFATTA